MRGPAVHPIAIAAGGTGGHFFPAEALAAELIRRGERVVLLTDARSGGLTSPTFASAERFVISGAGIAGRGVVRAGKAIAGLAMGVAQARRILARLNVAAVVGFGGYPSVAPVIASRLLARRPVVVLHEQNGVLGRANRFLSRHADRIALSLPGTTLVPAGVATDVTGNPVRPAIMQLADAPYHAPEHDIRLLVLGGSLGARVFSDIVPPALALLPDAMRVRLSVTQQCRQEDVDRVRDAYATSGVQAELAPFFTDIAARLAAAHLVIARAGASTVAELAVAGRPSVLVPLPGAIDDHQRANAAALVEARGASMIDQNDFTPRALADALERMFDEPGDLAHTARCARTIARPDASARLADLVESLVRERVRA